nr:MAG: hypothetical protein [Microvirus sp.]
MTNYKPWRTKAGNAKRRKINSKIKIINQKLKKLRKKR